jgi:hypothetical protein
LFYAVISTGQKDQVKQSNKYIKLRTESAKRHKVEGKKTQGGMEGCSLWKQKKGQVEEGKRLYSDVRNANERELKNTIIIIVVPDTNEGEKIFDILTY